MSTTAMDMLGRVVIKSDIREALSIDQGSRFHVTVEEGAIVLRPIERICAICKCPIHGGREVPVCDACITMIKDM